MSGIIAFIVKQLLGLGLPEELAKPLAWVVLVLTAAGLAWGAKATYDSDVVQDALAEARSNFLEEKDEATGDADAEFDEDQRELEEEIKTTEELIDEALEKGCAVGEYLASNGTNCVR